MADKLQHWLEQLDLGTYADLFAKNDVDFEVLPELTDDELKELGLSLGHRKRLLKAIAGLADPTPAQTAPLADQSATSEAERRQLTVMFCDLVGSTALSQRLDPEDLRDLMRRYQDAVAGAVTRYGGHVAKYLGDGVLVYFGWPQAHEDQAERAVRAGLDAVEAVAEVHTEVTADLTARVGIATGQVVVGDLVGKGGRDTDAVIGETPNLAARLQSVAEPGQIVVGSVTRALIGGAFDLVELSRQHLKGFTDPVPAWRVVREATGSSRFKAAHGSQLLPFVGRQGELNILRDRWETARGGEGQVVVISGEAGIGKSRLLEALFETIADQDHLRVHYQCAPYHANSAYFPIIRQLDYAASLLPDDSTEAKLDKLEELLVAMGDKATQAAPLFASLLSIPFEERFGVSDLNPEQRKLRTEAAIVNQLRNLSRQRPLVATFEDVHWADPTTRELLQNLVAGIDDIAMLLVITHRPEFDASWPDRTDWDNFTNLPLQRLSQAQMVEMIDKAGGEDLPESRKQHIAAHGDGVPLFIEELTHSLLSADANSPGSEIPTTLQASLTARLDGLGAAKRTAEVAAVIGREVSGDLLAAVSPLTQADLERDLEGLMSSGLVSCDDRGSDARYVFKHALVQDAAYEMLLRDRRRGIHRDIAVALEANFPARAEAEPELLAHHFAAGRQPERAAPLWLRAGQQSLGRSAIAEAVAQIERGLADLAQIAPSRERDSLEIDLQSCFALASMMHKGYAAEATERAHLRSRELLSAFDDDPRHTSVLHGLCTLYGARARFYEFLDFARELVTRAEHLGDDEAMCAGYRCLAVGYNSRGEFTQAYDASLRAIDYFIPEKHQHSAHRYAQDVGVAAKMHLAIASQNLGQIDKAAQLIEDALALAHDLKHINTISYAHLWASFLRLTKHDFAATRETVKAMRKVAFDAALPDRVNQTLLFEGAALSAVPETAKSGIKLMDKYLTASPVVYMRTVFICFRAEGSLNLGQYDEASALIEEGLELVEKTGERWWEAELHRLRGEVLRAQGTNRDAEASFQKSMAVAQGQVAKLLELRAATSLAGLWHAQGKGAEARDLLSPLYDWFTEGFDAPDLVAAKVMLDALG